MKKDKKLDIFEEYHNRIGEYLADYAGTSYEDLMQLLEKKEFQPYLTNEFIKRSIPNKKIILISLICVIISTIISAISLLHSYGLI